MSPCLLCQQRKYKECQHVIMSLNLDKSSIDASSPSVSISPPPSPVNPGCNWCKNRKLASSYCSHNVELLTVKCRPFYLPWEFTVIIFIAVYIPPSAKVSRWVFGLQEPWKHYTGLLWVYWLGHVQGSCYWQWSHADSGVWSLCLHTFKSARRMGPTCTMP